VRSARAAGGPERSVSLAQWIDDDGEPIEPLGTPEPVNPTEALRDVGEWLSHQIERARETEAAPGPRFGQAADQAQRTGSSEDVVVAVPLRWSAAAAQARRGEVFDPPLRHLRIEIGSLEIHGDSCSWQATVRTGLYRKRTATLRIDPSPSGILTILQLVPASVCRFRTQSFVRAGVPALREFSERLSLQLS
jgi:hypothetical protein